MTFTIPTGATVFCLAGAFGDPTNIPTHFGGAVTNGNTVVPVAYSNNNLGGNVHIESAATNLDAAMSGVAGMKIVLAHSEGSVGCAWWLSHQALTTVIPVDELLFVLTGNSVRPYGGLCLYSNWYPGALIPSDTPFTVIDYAAQYDKYADYPPGSAPGSAIHHGSTNMAFRNVMKSNEHDSYPTRLLNDPNSVVYQEGNISYVWSLTYPMPLAVGSMITKVAALDAKDRPEVEAGYARPIAPPSPGV